MTGWMFDAGYGEVTIGPVEYEKLGAVETRLVGGSRKCAGYRRRVPSVHIYPSEQACREAAAARVESKIAGLRAEATRWEKILADLPAPAESEVGK